MRKDEIAATNNQPTLIPLEDQSFEIAISEKHGLAGTMAKDANQLYLRQYIKGCIVKAHLTCGRTYETEDLTFLIDGLKFEILRSYAGIRVSEIGLALHKGSVGDYGKIYNLSLNTLVDWLRQYMASESRLLAFKEHNQKRNLLEQKTKPSDQEILAGKRQVVIDAFEKYKVKDVYIDYGNYIFESLVDFGILSFTEEEVNILWKQGQVEVYRQLTSNTGTIDERHERRKKLQEVKANKEHALFYQETKRFALNLYFKHLKQKNIELSDLLK